MIKILGTGLTGMVGSRLVKCLEPQFKFIQLNHDSGFDIRDFEAVQKHISASDAEWVLHLAAKTDVDDCEKDRQEGEAGNAWQINAVGTANMAKAASNLGRRLIYFSTDFVFAGNGETATESTAPDPVNWYGQTKLVGEKAVLSHAGNAVVRISFPYGVHPAGKGDFVKAMLARLKGESPLIAVTDQIITPTWIDDIAEVVKLIIYNGASGIFHAVGSDSLSPYEIALTIARAYGIDESKVQPAKYADYYRGKAARPLNMRLSSDRIKKFNLNMHGFTAGLDMVKRQGGSL